MLDVYYSTTVQAAHTVSWTGDPQRPLAVTVDNTGEICQRSGVFYCTAKAWDECVCEVDMHMCDSCRDSGEASLPHSGPPSMRLTDACAGFVK